MGTRGLALSHVNHRHFGVQNFCQDRAGVKSPPHSRHFRGSKVDRMAIPALKCLAKQSLASGFVIVKRINK